jgi:hypothetical protein
MLPKPNSNSCHSWIEHDITFCISGLCPLNKKCYRFIDNHKFDGEVISTSNFYIEENENKCKEFMKLEV